MDVFVKVETLFVLVSEITPIFPIFNFCAQMTSVLHASLIMNLPNFRLLFKTLSTPRTSTTSCMEAGWPEMQGMAVCGESSRQGGNYQKK